MRQKGLDKCLACLIIIFVCFSACDAKDESGNLPTQMEAPITAGANPQDVVDGKEKTYLSCYEEGTLPEIASIGGGKLLALTSTYTGEHDITNISVIDIAEDKVTARLQVEEYVSFVSTTDEGFILEDFVNQEYLFYDCDFNLSQKFEPDNMCGRFSPDGKSYYEVICGKLYREDVKTRELSLIEVSPQLEFSENINGITSDGRYAELFYENYDGGEYRNATVRVELESGNADIMTYDLTMAGYGEHKMYFRMFNPSEDMEEFYCVWPEREESVVIEISQYDIMALENSNYLICTDVNSVAQEMSDDSGFLKMYLGYFDEKHRCMMAPLNEDGSDGFLYYLTYMQDDELIAFCYEKDGTYRIGLLAPRLLEYDELAVCEKSAPRELYDETVYREYCEYLELSEIPECPEYLKTVREEADRLEELYDIKLYMSEECRNMVQDKGYDCTSELEQDVEYDLIKIALEEIEKALLKYPDNFFSQFRTRTGEGGIRICLVSNIQDDYSAAYAVKINQWYNIVLDIHYNNEFNLSHELWHSTESLINFTDSSLLTDQDWQEFNPEGFEYDMVYTDRGGDFTEYCYGVSSDWYFYDDYSKADSLEDKARIMEVVMCPEYFPADDFVASEQIKKKLNCMCKAVREVFDTSDWEEVYWERFTESEVP